MLINLFFITASPPFFQNLLVPQLFRPKESTKYSFFVKKKIR
jgi:hypothetical protein